MTTELFHHTTSTGVEIALPRFRNVPAGVIRRLRKANNLDFMFGVLEESADEATLTALDGLGIDEVSGIVDAWQKDAGVSAGESSASSTS